MSPTRAALAMLLAMTCAIGCNFQNPGGNAPAVQPTANNPTYMGKDSAVKPTEGEPTAAVDSAVHWAEKYAKLSEDMIALQTKHDELLKTNGDLRTDLVKVQADRDEAVRELKAANDMLLELKKELGDWKSSVMGYRKEMLDGQAAQIRALERVLRILGGQVEPPPTATSAPADARPAETRAAEGAH